MRTKKISLRMTEEEYEEIRVIALELGYKYGKKGSVVKFLRAVLKGELATIPKEVLKKYLTKW